MAVLSSVHKKDKLGYRDQACFGVDVLASTKLNWDWGLGFRERVGGGTGAYLGRRLKESNDDSVVKDACRCL